jgi:hypothetical protein
MAKKLQTPAEARPVSGASASQVVLVLPILNATFKLPGKVVYLDDDVLIGSISSSDLGGFLKGATDGYATWIQPDSQCIHMTLTDNAIRDEDIQAIAHMCQFTFNSFAATGPLRLGFGCVFSRNGSESLLNRLVDLSELGGIALDRSVGYTCRKGVQQKHLMAHFRLVRRACANADPPIFTIDRFNTALVRSRPYDRIVDLTIALESLFWGQSELSYRFALGMSRLLVNSPESLTEFNALFRSLYSARSGIVHGEPRSRDIAAVEARWDDLIEYAKIAINYYLSFRVAESRENWDSHMKGVCLGTEAGSALTNI